MARTGGGTRADGRATAEQVVIAAERLFAERGVEAVSLREVVRRRDVNGPGDVTGQRSVSACCRADL